MNAQNRDEFRRRLAEHHASETECRAAVRRGIPTLFKSRLQKLIERTRQEKHFGKPERQRPAPA